MSHRDIPTPKATPTFQRRRQSNPEGIPALILPLMARSRTTTITWEGKSLPLSLLTEQRSDGLYYEVNIPDVPRFRMHWSALGRYDVVPGEGDGVPYELVLLVADVIGTGR